MEELIKRGAEADILLGWWGPLRAVYKVRKPKPYMIAALDLRLRRGRTAREATMISRSREAGVNTPFLFYVGMQTFTIVMQYIQGPTMKELLNERPALSAQLGKALAKLHSAGIVHGDPNTANFILSSSDGLWYTVDFGLSLFSKELEDVAVDVHIVKEMLAAQHQGVLRPALDHFLSGYSEAAGEPRLAQVLRKLKEIERRGRYARQPVG